MVLDYSWNGVKRGLAPNEALNEADRGINILKQRSSGFPVFQKSQLIITTLTVFFGHPTNRRRVVPATHKPDRGNSFALFPQTDHAYSPTSGIINRLLKLVIGKRI